MITAAGVLSCFQRLTSSFAVLGKSFSTISSRRWLNGFQSRPALAASVRWSSYGLLKSNVFGCGHSCRGQLSQRAWPFIPSKVPNGMLAATIAVRGMASLKQMHMTGPHYKKRTKKRPLDGNPFLKGVVLKTLIKKPKKPNSANRRCVLVRMSNGKEAVAHVPGEGHNLQEHNIVLVRCGRLQDVPGVRLKVMRGMYDCAHVVKKTQINS